MATATKKQLAPSAKKARNDLARLVGKLFTLESAAENTLTKFREYRDEIIPTIKACKLQRTEQDLEYVVGLIAIGYGGDVKAKRVALNEKKTSLVFDDAAGGARGFWNRYIVPNMARQRAANKADKPEQKIRGAARTAIAVVKGALNELRKALGKPNLAERAELQATWKAAYAKLIATE